MSGDLTQAKNHCLTCGRPYPYRDWLHVRSKVTVAEIIHKVAKHSRLKATDLTGKSHRREFAWPRQLAMWLSHKLRPDLSFQVIGRRFDRDHTTVMYACRVVEDRRAREGATLDPAAVWEEISNGG